MLGEHEFPACEVDPGARKQERYLKREDVLTVKVLRPTTGSDDTGTVRALDLKGLPLGEAPYAFKTGDRETDAALDLPVEIRNDIARLEIGNERSAGAVQLLDKRWRRRTIGVITGSTAETAQPLLASTFYLSRALSPFADIRVAERASPGEAVAQFIEQRLPMIVLADVGNVAGDAHGRLDRWIDEGGVLVRFAGPRLAASDDELVTIAKLSADDAAAIVAFRGSGRPFKSYADLKKVAGVDPKRLSAAKPRLVYAPK